jgi:hypothetical protein
MSDPSDEPPKADEPAKEQVIPVKKTRVVETSTALTLSYPPKPEQPTSTSDDSSINMGNVMKEIIPWTLHHLLIALATGTQPLNIKARSVTDFVSCKEIRGTRTRQ